MNNNNMDRVADILGVQLNEIFCEIFTMLPNFYKWGGIARHIE